MVPGSRVDFHWTDQSGPGFVSHVPWALMYMEVPGWPFRAGSGSRKIPGFAFPDRNAVVGCRQRLGSGWRLGNHRRQRTCCIGATRPATMSRPKPAGRPTSTRCGSGRNCYPIRRSRTQTATDTGAGSAGSSAGERSLFLLPLQRWQWSTTGPAVWQHFKIPGYSQPYGHFARAQPAGRAAGIRNACTTSQADPHMTSELEQRFFERGVRAFIGTETKVPTRLPANSPGCIFSSFFGWRIPISSPWLPARLSLKGAYISVDSIQKPGRAVLQHHEPV